MHNIVDLLSINTFRYEKKYVISSANENIFIFHLNRHPFLFERAYDDRYVNNIYFDSPSMSSYWDNVSGLSKRVKVRIRWYGDLYGHIQSPILEFKIRNNTLGSKVSFKLSEMFIDSELTIDSIHKQFNQLDVSSPIKEFLFSLRMTLMNGYSRKYYVSKDQKYRLTYDSDLQFISVDNYNNSFKHIIKPSNRRVLEIKYDEHMDDHASQISNYFPFRMTKSSKYVFGVDKLKL
tara:strand:- start:119 stop:820 length:702 start_codon:yes stop_codon:yes gene_type:complete